MLLAEAFRLSITPHSLGLAFAGVLLMTFGWKLAGVFLVAEGSDQVSASTFHDVVSAWPGEPRTEHSAVRETLSRSGYEIGSGEVLPIDPLYGVPLRTVEPFRRLLTSGRSWSTFFYYLTGGLLTILVWSWVGTALTRKSVMCCGLEQTTTFSDDFEFARRRWFAVFSAVTLPLVAITMLALPFALLGLLMRWDAGMFLGGVLWVFVLLAGVLMAILSLGLMLGWPLMWGAVCTENSDGFDAISRAYAYTFQRPLHYLMYLVAAGFLSIFGCLLAWWIAEAIISLSFWAVQFGAGADRVRDIQALVEGRSPAEELNGAMRSGVAMIRFATGVVRGFASAFSFSFFWCSAGAIYLLLRRDLDETDIDDVILVESNSETHAQSTSE